MLAQVGQDQYQREARPPADPAASFSDASFGCVESCDACCRRAEGVALTESDRKRLSRCRPGLDFAEPREHPVFPYRLKTVNRACLFLNERGRCSVYTSRPLLCRLYPLQIHLDWKGEVLWCLEHCPGVNAAGARMIDRQYLAGADLTLTRLESRRFLDVLGAYLGPTKRPPVPLLYSAGAIIHSDWPTRIKAKDQIWGLVGQVGPGSLTPRQRMECLFYDVLPVYFSALTCRARRSPESGALFIDQAGLTETFGICRPSLVRLFSEASAAEKRRSRGAMAVSDSAANGAGPARDFCRIAPQAARAEESYLRELTERQGRFGPESTNLPVDAESFLVVLAAQVLEGEAATLALKKGQPEVSFQEMKEAIWIVERRLSRLLQFVINLIPPQGLVSRDGRPQGSRPA